MYFVSPNWQVWYEGLVKPSWTPASGTIGLIWSILYPMILIALVYVVYLVYKKKLPSLVQKIFGLNVLSNLIFTPIQFGWLSLFWASVDILVVLASLVYLIYLLWPRQRFLALWLSPYLAWVSIATVLQLTITLLNW